jgi:hypothetical protein
MVTKIGRVLVEEDIYGKAKGPFYEPDSLGHLSPICCKDGNRLGEKRAKDWLYGDC